MLKHTEHRLLQTSLLRLYSIIPAAVLTNIVLKEHFET